MLSEGDSYSIRTDATVRYPGSTTAQLVERFGVAPDAVEFLLRPLCLRDSTGRWWPMMQVGKLFAGCHVRATPAEIDPAESHGRGWKVVEHVLAATDTTTVQLRNLDQTQVDGSAAAAWQTVPSTQLVIYRPHPMLWAGNGPWG